MTDLLHRRLTLLARHRSLLAGGLRGIERETLRVEPDGTLAMTPHPEGLGAALTHPLITTDYSEALLEFITSPEADIARGLAQLDRIHRYAYTQIGDELLWSQSMPCRLPAEDEIPIARYGSSNIGRLKHVYRQGLALRYGRTMQCIAGIHYNYSLDEALWQVLQDDDGAARPAQDDRSERYIALIRNFDRYRWLLMVLFGASPALSEAFMRGRPHQLERLSADTLYLPWATSLRMSDLGYQNNAQAGLLPAYNDLPGYMRQLAHAVQQPYPPYDEIGTRRGDEWLQINTNLLQIENEYYATIRPKRVIRPGERPLEALASRGIQYVEVRCLDVNPFEPVGIGLETTRFLDAFLLFCALDASPPTSPDEGRENAANFAAAVKEGRRPGLVLQRGGAAIALRDWALQLLDRIGDAAELLDAAAGDSERLRSVKAQRERLLEPESLPSARALAALADCDRSFQAFGMRQSLAHREHFCSRPLAVDERRDFEHLAQVSLQEQQAMESAPAVDFERFVADYQRLPAIP